MKDRHPKKKTKKKADNRSIAAKKATKNVKTKVKSKNIDRAELLKAMRIKGLDLTGLKRGGKVKRNEPRRNTEAEGLTGHDPRLTDQPA